MTTTTEAGHTEKPWQLAKWLTGPTTPDIEGVTVQESVEYFEFWERKHAGKPVGEYPKARHTAISVGKECVAIAVGPSHKARAAFIVKACNSWNDTDALRARLAELEGRQ